VAETVFGLRFEKEIRGPRAKESGACVRRARGQGVMIIESNKFVCVCLRDVNGGEESAAATPSGGSEDDDESTSRRSRSALRHCSRIDRIPSLLSIPRQLHHITSARQEQQHSHVPTAPRGTLLLALFLRNAPSSGPSRRQITITAVTMRTIRTIDL
jgi:hypothetical protein